MVRTKRLLLLLGIGIMSFGLVAPADAVEEAPTLAGKYQVQSTITRAENTVDVVGSKAIRPWIFDPCDGCSPPEVLLHRKRITANKFTDYTLIGKQTQAGVWVFKGKTVSLTDCFNEDGSVAEPDGLKTTERISLTVLQVDANNIVTEFKGTFDSRFEPATAESPCQSGLTKFKFKSVSGPE